MTAPEETATPDRQEKAPEPPALVLLPLADAGEPAPGFAESEAEPITPVEMPAEPEAAPPTSEDQPPPPAPRRRKGQRRPPVLVVE
jgi:hypothetical protein